MTVKVVFAAGLGLAVGALSTYVLLEGRSKEAFALGSVSQSAAHTGSTLTALTALRLQRTDFMDSSLERSLDDSVLATSRFLPLVKDDVARTLAIMSLGQVRDYRTKFPYRDENESRREAISRALDGAQ